uniref:Gypsy retrotransposon integrase-like protein 1 n=1 Tax=Gadus morhua TaxID=8049 RepID=A0A8C4ZN90_GADMO
MLYFPAASDEQLYYSFQGKLRLVVCNQVQVCNAFKECHDNLGSGGHPGRRRTTEKVLASYHWKTLREDVKKSVDECPRCQRHEKIKTVAPVLHPISVKEAWSVLGVDLMGPLPTTAKATDLFTKWVVAKCLYTKTTAEVTKKIVSILLDFGLVEKIITDQGREFVNEVNRGVLETLGVKHCITSAYHPQANGQAERTNRNIKEALAKYCGEGQNDWDAHLKGIVASINTSKQVILCNSCICIHSTLNQDKKKVADLHAENYNINILSKTGKKKAYETRKGRNVKSFHFQIGDEVLKANKRKEGRKGGRLESNWFGPYVVASISEKGVATLSSTKGAPLKQRVNVSQLKPFTKPNLRGIIIVDTRTHYTNRPGAEILVQDGNVCLTREDFLSLGLPQFMESNVSILKF